MNNLKKIWIFLSKDDSLKSWILSIFLAFIVVKFLIYPFIGLIFSTSYPIVAVISGSMDHEGLDFDDWWNNNEGWYGEKNITKGEFSDFKFKNGFSKGDIILLIGKQSKDIKVGDVLIFHSTTAYPVIHRIVESWEVNGSYHFQTKGDNNSNIIIQLNEHDISEDRIVGVAMLKIPYAGWIKIIASEVYNGVRGVF